MHIYVVCLYILQCMGIKHLWSLRLYAKINIVFNIKSLSGSENRPNLLQINSSPGDSNYVY